MNSQPPRGAELLANPVLNRGTAFTDAERAVLGLHGLLPPYVETLDEQVLRAWEAYTRKEDDLERHIYLRALQDTNETLFYRLLLDHIAATTPIVYTPVVADACRQFSHIYRRPRGLILSYPWRDSLLAMLRNRPHRDIDVIVVTDGERILGIGDQGVGGLGIPIGKLALYTLFGGIHPARTLPIVLDVGTNNQERLRDPEYLGWRHERLAGADYDDFLARFVAAVQAEIPQACLQWEDFATRHARPLLDRYRDQLLSFNDDIQGTAAVALGAAEAAIHAAGAAASQPARLRDQVWVFFGAGSAALGVADYFRAAMITDGLPEAAARAAFWMVDSAGLIHEGRDDLAPDKRAYAQPFARLVNWRTGPGGVIGVAEVVKNIRATGLIGLSTFAGAFDEAVVRELAHKVDCPIIFPLSNPTECSEARPEDLMRWTAGRALIATGSPFPPVQWGGRSISIAQCNNVYIFPAVGLGVVASRARRVSDGMMMAAARELARHSPALEDPSQPLLPRLEDLRTVAVEIAVAVGLEAQRAELAPAISEEQLRARVLATRWTPAYPASASA